MGGARSTHGKNKKRHLLLVGALRGKIPLGLLRVDRKPILKYFWAVSWLRSLVAGISPRSHGFAPVSIHVGFMVDKVALGQVFLRVFRFSPVNISFHSRSPNSYRLGNA
jgi:hypothetical protein